MALPRTENRPDRGGWVRAALLLLALSLVQAAVVLPSLGQRGNWDWDKDFFFADAQRETLLRYRELPLWNPWSYGGMPMLAHPESTWLSPSFCLFILPFGAILGHQFRALVGLWLGALGAWRFARGRGLEGAPALLAAGLYMFSGFYALHLWMGHTMWVTVALFPWLLERLDEPRRPWRATATAALLLCWIYLDGAMYVLVFAILFVLAEGALRALAERRGRPLVRAALAVSLGLALAGPKLLPMLEFLGRNPRLHIADRAFGANDAALAGLAMLRVHFVAGDYADRLPFEDGAYIGWLPVALVALGVAVACRRRFPVLATGLAFLAIALGDSGIPGLWTALRRLPVFEQMLLPARYLFGCLVPIALFAGEGLGWLERRLPRGRWLSAGLLVLVLSDLVASNIPVYRAMFPGQQPVPEFAGGAFRGHRRDSGAWTMFMLPYFRANVGLLNGQPNIPRPEPRAIASDAPGYRGEAFLERGAGKVTIAGWSPSRVAIDIELTQPSVLVLNQNFDPGWAVEGRGAARRSEQGLVAADLLAGVGDSGRLVLRYRPRYGLAGALLAILAALALARLWTLSDPGPASLVSGPGRRRLVERERVRLRCRRARP